MKPSSEITILNEKGISDTPIRVLVLRTLLKNKTAYSFKALEEELFFSDKSTIFRTLQLFKKKGVVHEVMGLDGVRIYALCDVACINKLHTHDHGHLKCKVCRKTKCIPLNFSNTFLKTEKFMVDDIVFFINGTCSDCNSVAE